MKEVRCPKCNSNDLTHVGSRLYDTEDYRLGTSYIIRDLMCNECSCQFIARIQLTITNVEID